jgi:serine/threonine-protein kinase
VLVACPKCQRSFPTGEATFCPADATRLEPIEQVPLPADPNEPFIGHTIAGKYEIRRVVAEGGMGRVYEGRQLDLQRRIAVKILHADVAQDAVNIERFKREAETSRALEHRHIIDVVDFAQEKPAPGRPDGAWYLVMEYLDGEELRAVLDREKVLPISRVIHIVAQTAIAMDGAHKSGAVHRDLKPDNIFLVRVPGQGDLVKVLDFGSVKFTKGQDKGQKLTVLGTTIGSPFYMSPEQAKGLPDLDHRADVWALGAIVYEMTVGKVPFLAPNGPQILFKILSEEPMPPSFANDAAPPQLDDFIVRALHKDRNQRYQSCGELADALGHAFGLSGTHLDWAGMAESALAAQLGSAEAASKQAAIPAPTAPAKSAAMPFPMAPPKPSQVKTQPFQMGPIPADVPDDYSPVKKTPVGLYVAIALAVVVIGGVVAVLAMR